MDMWAGKARSYIELLRGNRDFTRFWIAQFISMIGDWMNTVALLGLILSLTGSGLDAGLYFVSALLPFVVITPFCGVLADRYNRKALMIASDFISFFLILGFLLIHRRSQMGLLYLLNILASVAEAFFVPSAQAAFPNLVDSEQLYTANTLSGATWGITLAVGAGLGGIVDIFFGRAACFAANAASFLIAGLLIMTIHRPFSSGERARESSGGWSDLKKGLDYAATHPPVRRLLAFEACLGFATGAVLLYSIFPAKIFHDGDFGIGVLYAVRGVANFPGPFVVRELVGEDLRSLWRGMIGSGIIIGVFYLFFSISPNLEMAAAAVFGAHMANAAFWVLASLFVQRIVPDAFLGRVASMNTSAFTLAMTVSTLSCGFFVEHSSPRLAAAFFGLFTLLFAGWIAFLIRRDRG